MIAGYDVRETLRRGDGQSLMRARRIADGKSVLIKTTCREHGSSADLDEATREASLLGDLRVRGVPRCLELIQQPGLAALVLDDAGGSPLARWLESGSPGIDASLRIALGLSTILVELHRREIVHRNLHPGSILTSQVGSSRPAPRESAGS
jgi:histidine kinase